MSRTNAIGLVRGERHDRRGGRGGADLARRARPAAARHVDVDERDVGPVLGGQRDRLVRVGRRAQDVEAERELRREHGAHVGVVVGDQDARRRAGGRVGWLRHRGET
jgi:hypothetical protein